MAGKQMSGDSYASQLAGMSKNQLYEIMSQMKTLIEQNQQQAKQILVDNPLLTKALFQAQIMLGMVQPPQVMPNIQQTLSQPPQPQQSMKPSQQPNAQSTQSFPVQSVVPGQASSFQPQYPSKHLQSSQASAPLPSASAPSVTLPPLVGSQHSKGQLNAQPISMSLQQPSQVHNSLHPLHSATAQSSVLQPPPISSQSQQPQSLQTPGILRQPLHPPLPPQPRPSSLPMFSHQIHSQMAPSMGFQQPQHMSQPMFHSAVNPQPGIGNFSQGHGQPPLPNQLPPQHLYKVGSHTGDYGSSQGATPMQLDRTAPWMSDNAGSGIHLPGLTPHGPGQMSSNVHQPRPPQLTPEMEKTLLLQVMSLTPEQINLLPPEQRHQVLQLQQMLR